MNHIEKLKVSFVATYGKKPKRIFFAPGRVNLIGEHIDYNGGLVFPCALTLGTYMAINLRNDKKIRLKSLNFPEILSCDLDKIEKTEQWFDYCIFVVKLLQDRGLDPLGMDILYYGTIPNGAGLSSSASIELVTAYAINTLSNGNFSNIDLAKLSREVENNFIGVNCGIMDQFAVAMGAENQAIALNCDSLDYFYVPLNLGDYTLVISNTNVKRQLIDSKYNERLKECRKALSILANIYNINYLCEANEQQLESSKHLFADDTVYRRARHVISEQSRVLAAVDLLKQNNLQDFGEMMNRSHDSLRDDYEVTGYNLDTMVEEGRKIYGVMGSRMTGAGFGGCTITLLHKDSVVEFTERVGAYYKNKTKLTPDFYDVGIGAGVIEL